MAKVPDTNTFSLQDVVDVINPTTDDLQDCFNDSIDGRFDPRYKGSKDRLSNFRNYGKLATLSFVETEDHGGYYYDMASADEFIFVAAGWLGIHTYTASATGYMLYRHTKDLGDYHIEFIWQSNDIIFASGYRSSPDNRAVLLTFTWDAFGELTLVDTITAYLGTFSFGPMCTDGIKFLFVGANPSYGSQGFRVYQYDSSGNLTYKTAWNLGLIAYYDVRHEVFDGVHFIYWAVSSSWRNGILSFSIHQTTGSPTYITDEDGALGGGFHGIEWGEDGTRTLLCNTSLDRAAVFTVIGDGYPSLEDYDGTLNGASDIPYSSHDGILFAVYPGNNVRLYRLDQNKDLVQEDTVAISNIHKGGWSAYYPDVFFALRGYDGISSYTVD